MQCSAVVFTTYAYKIYLLNIFKIEKKTRGMLGVVCAVFLCFNQIVSSQSWRTDLVDQLNITRPRSVYMEHFTVVLFGGINLKNYTNIHVYIQF